MQTRFTLEQLADPRNAAVNDILRSCVHCGFCTATCPTYVLLGDELDSPRGRIYLVKTMLEDGAAATPEVALHIDRCLSCLSCMTTCPSGVNYMHLIDAGRAHVEETWKRPPADRLRRWLLATVMPRPALFRLAVRAAAAMRPLAPLLRRLGLAREAAMLSLVPPRPVPPDPRGGPGIHPAEGRCKGRVALLMGCVQSVLAPAINAAAIRLLTRQGYEVVVAGEEACCGSLTHHMGREADALARARRSIDQWTRADVAAVVITASGCGTTVKDYGYMLRHDPAYAEKAAAISAKARDVTEFIATLDLPPQPPKALRVTYHAACSLQHGQKLKTLPQELLRRAGFTLAEVPEGHLCCGSAGTYNMLQPELSQDLRARKLANIATTTPQVVATGNLGCMAQLGSGLAVPVLHTVELLDWAYGGPIPSGMKSNGGIG